MNRATTSTEAIYNKFGTLGMQYGPALRAIRTVFLGDTELLVHLAVPDVVRGAQQEYFLHPSLLDGALQSSIPLVGDQHLLVGRPLVPFSVAQVTAVSKCLPEMMAWVRLSHASTQNRVVTLDLDLCDLAGNIAAELRGFAYRSLESQRSTDHNAEGMPSAQSIPFTRSEPDFFDADHYKRLIAAIASRDLSIADAVELG